MSAALAGSAWATEFVQLERGTGGVSLTALAGDGWMLMQTDIERATHQLAGIDRSVVAFGLPVSQQAPVRFGSRDIDSSQLTRFDTRVGLDAVTSRCFGAYTLACDRDRLAQHLHNLGLDASAAILDQPQSHKPIPESKLFRLRKLMGDLVAAVRRGGVLDAREQMLDAESGLVLEIISAFYCCGESTHAPASNRSRVLKRALEYIRGHANQVLTVEDLCRESATSISTLERAFREHFGVSPKQYLVASRLSGARRTLLDPANSAGIGDVAAHWGFWHLSKFAADYKRLYGELPSATRKLAA